MELQHVQECLEFIVVYAGFLDLFSKNGTEITDLFRGGITTIIDLSAYVQVEGGNRIKALVIGLVSKKILEQRMAARKAEEIKLISEGGFLFGAGVVAGRGVWGLGCSHGDLWFKA